MNLALFYDTETTGLPDFRAPSEAEHQPHIVQLAAQLVDLDARRCVASLDVIVRPNGWTIPAEVAAIHGITQERATLLGVPEDVAVGMFMELWNGRKRIAHNEQFDARILRIALLRCGDLDADAWKDGLAECTAELATPLCKIPPTPRMLAAGFNKYKTANLTEAHTKLCGKPFDGAHSALADVEACRAVYFAIKDAAVPQAA